MFAPDPNQTILLFIKGTVGFYKVIPKPYNLFGSTYFYWKDHDQPEWHGPFVTPSETSQDHDRVTSPQIVIPDANVILIDFTKKRRI